MLISFRKPEFIFLKFFYRRCKSNKYPVTKNAFIVEISNLYQKTYKNMLKGTC
jgi:hypothetical protein